MQVTRVPVLSLSCHWIKHRKNETLIIIKNKTLAGCQEHNNKLSFKLHES